MTKLIISDVDFIVSDVKVTDINPNFYTESLNFIGNSKSRGLHRLKIEFKITLVDASDIKRFTALMLQIRGRLNSFGLSLQDETDGKGFMNPLHTAGTPMISNALSVGNNRITLTGISTPIPAGSRFQFANDTKVYTLLSDARNNKSVEFFPATRQPHMVKEKINLRPVPLMRLERDESSIKYERTTEISLVAMEAL